MEFDDDGAEFGEFHRRNLNRRKAIAGFLESEVSCRLSPNMSRSRHKKLQKIITQAHTGYSGLNMLLHTLKEFLTEDEYEQIAEPLQSAFDQLE